MNTSFWEFLALGGVVAILLALNALLVACESSLVKLRYSDPEEFDLDALRRRKRLAYLMARADWAAPVMRFGVMVLALGTGLALFPLLDFLLASLAWPDAPLGRFLEAVVAFVLSASVVSFWGYLLPRAFALSDPIRALRVTSWVVIGLVAALLPWFRVVRAMARRFFGLLGWRFQHDFNVLDFEVQIRALAEGQDPPSPYLRKVLRNTLRLRDLEASDVLLPRNQVQIFDLEQDLEENLALARDTGHTRFPLCEGDLDRCTGIIHIKDLFRHCGPLRADHLSLLKRRIERFPENAPLEYVLQRMLAMKAHMALVVDEFGGALGVVTLETILEELVGDIEDEFDTPEAEELRRTGPGEYIVDGLMAIHDLEEELGVTIDNDEVSTVGGLVTATLGRIPEPGEVVELPEPGLRIAVKDADERRVLSATVKVVPPVEPGGD